MKFDEGEIVIYCKSDLYSVNQTELLINERYVIGGYSEKPYSEYIPYHYYWLIDKNGKQTHWYSEDCFKKDVRIGKLKRICQS